jgi:hypothetical protein
MVVYIYRLVFYFVNDGYLHVKDDFLHVKDGYFIAKDGNARGPIDCKGCLFRQIELKNCVDGLNYTAPKVVVFFTCSIFCKVLCLIRDYFFVNLIPCSYRQTSLNPVVL